MLYILFSSLTEEETCWIKLQNQKYENIKTDFNIKSLFCDLILVLSGQKSIIQTFESKIFNCMKMKFERFLKNSTEFQSLPLTHQETLKNRNIVLSSLLLALIAQCQTSGADQWTFIQKQFSSNVFSNFVTSMIQPKQKLTMKFVHENVQTFFASEEEENHYVTMLQTIQKVDMFEYFDYQILIIAMLFHSDYEVHVPQLTQYRNSLLRILQKKNRERCPQFDAMNIFLEFVDMMRTFSKFSRVCRVFNAL